MPQHAVADLAQKPDERYGAKTAYRVLYDGQCEICQACVSRLTILEIFRETEECGQGQ
jgi:hypothetical protein